MGRRAAKEMGGDNRLFFSSRRRHTRYWRDWSSDVCSSDLIDLTRSENHPFQQVCVSQSHDSLITVGNSRRRVYLSVNEYCFQRVCGNIKLYLVDDIVLYRVSVNNLIFHTSTILITLSRLCDVDDVVVRELHEGRACREHHVCVPLLELAVVKSRVYYKRQTIVSMCENRGNTACAILLHHALVEDLLVLELYGIACGTKNHSSVGPPLDCLFFSVGFVVLLLNHNLNRTYAFEVYHRLVPLACYDRNALGSCEEIQFAIVRNKLTYFLILQEDIAEVVACHLPYHRTAVVSHVMTYLFLEYTHLCEQFACRV